MLSRVADSLYWMARYIERAEQTARILDVHLTLMLDQFPGSASERWHRMLASLCLERPETDEFDAKAVTYALTLDVDNAESIHACVAGARENARQIRDAISSEMWEQINRLYFLTKDADFEEVWREGQYEFLASVKQGCHLIQGVTDSTFSHGEGYQFIQMGRYSERALMSIGLLEAYKESYGQKNAEELNGAVAHLDWVALLKSSTAFEAYCSRYTANLKKKKILEFLLLDPDFPHSVRFSVDRLCHALHEVKDGQDWDTAALDKLAGRLHAALAYSDMNEILEGDISRFFEEIRERCEKIHFAINKVFIDYPLEKELEESTS